MRRCVTSTTFLQACVSASKRFVTQQQTAGAVTPPGKVKVTFVTQDGTSVPVYATLGQTLMEVARDVAKLDIEAACDGTCACSTCHVYLSEEHFKKLKEPSEDEMDMLDLAPKPKSTSRLSCQVVLTQDMDGMIATLPNETSNQLS